VALNVGRVPRLAGESYYNKTFALNSWAWADNKTYNDTRFSLFFEGDSDV
jgi:hypothetical protein